MHPLPMYHNFGNKSILAAFFESCGIGLVRRKRLSILLATAALIVAPLYGQALQEVEIRHGVQYATHDGVVLAGDYCVPKRARKFPVVVAAHGGAWQLGERTYTVFGDLTSLSVGLLFSP